MSAPPTITKKDRTTALIVLVVIVAFVAGTLFGIILMEIARPRASTFDFPPFDEPEPCVKEPCIPPPVPDSTLPPILPPPCARPDPQPSHGRDPACHRA